MRWAGSGVQLDVPDEMAIVDTFTRLIFADEGDYSHSELQVIAALRIVEPNMAVDDMSAMGIYLRTLGVAEMLRLVARVQQYLSHLQGPALGRRRAKSPAAKAY